MAKVELPSLEDQELTGEDVAEFCEVSASTVHAWMLDEGLPSRIDGRKRLVKLTDLGRFLAHKDRGKASSQRQRLAAAQADKVMLDLAVRRGELISLEQVRSAAVLADAALANELDGIRGRLAHELASVTDAGEIGARLFREHRAVRAAYARRLAELGTAPAPPVGAGGEADAAATQDAVGVGEQAAGPPAG